MALVEISNFPGTPKLRCRVPNGTLFYDWLAANDATFHRDLLIVRNGVKLDDDDELAFELSELDNIQIFDQPKGIVEDILSPIFKVVGQVFSFLAPKPAIANTGGNTVDSPNNSLTGQTNTARVYKAKPDIYGQVRSFPDLIQESVFEYVRQNDKDGGLKYVTEWMCIGIGRYDYESVRYSESSLGSLAGAEYEFHQPGEVIPQIVEGYGFDDVDGQEVPGQNEADDFPVETATANTVVSGTYSGGQIAMQIVKQSEFDYFMELVLPHAVTFTINVTYNTASGSVTTDATFSGTLISAVETNDGAEINPVSWYTFTMNQLDGPQDIPATATINTTTFILNDNEALVVGPFFSPVESSQLWLHTQSSLGGKKQTNWKVVIWKIDDNYNQIPGTTETFTYYQGTPHDHTSEVFYRTDKLTPAAGFGKYAISFQRTDNSSDASVLKVEEIHAINIRTNVVHPTDTLVRVKVRATENALGSRDRKYNALVTRRTITYDLSTQAVDYTLRPSRSFADAVAHTWLIMGGQPVGSIDLYGLYSIAESLPDKRLGYFDYTFDDENDSLGDRVQAICNAASVVAYWDDGVLTF
ncbi:host specificity factor TipJ family phage tail protein, partial [Klebsiella aerogenes]|uniref:host specificity factor TipJ family phage tail protein n=1 Tax=Klebsiella aerogenes TaxID=548 RepID=UPI00292F8CEA